MLLAALECTVACMSVNANNETILRPLFGVLNLKRGESADSCYIELITKQSKKC